MATAPETVTTITCAGCGREAAARLDRRGAPKMPRGKGGHWKRVRDSPYCPACAGALYRLRALTLPARGLPLAGGTLDELWAALRVAWDQCRQLVNWATTKRASLDRFRRPGESLEGAAFRREAPAPRPYLYPEARALFPDLPSQSVTALLQAAAGKYDARRYEVFWRFDSSLPTCRRAPLCLSGQAWRAEWREVEEEAAGGGTRAVKAAVVTFPLAGRRWAVRLRLGSGEHLRRAQAAFDELTRMPEGLRGELAIMARRSSTGSHRSTRPDREAGGGNTTRWRLMLKLVGRFERTEGRGRVRRGSLDVRTARNCLFVAEMPGWDGPWLLHADDLRGLVAAHRYRLARLSDDQKAERRRPRRRRVGMQGRLDVVTSRYRDALKSRIEYYCAQVAGLADRCGVAAVRYDDRNRKFCDPLAWAQVREALGRQLDNLGVRLEIAAPEGAASGGAVG